MIVFLTLIYIAILFLAVKIGIVKMNTFWKISPVLWMVALFFVLFVPMQWGAPAGAVRMYQSVIEITPNVSGEVVALLLRPGQRVGSLAMRSWVAFVEEGQRKLVVGIPQSRLRHVKKGQPVDIVLQIYPGQVFHAIVGDVVAINSAAQLQATGIIPQVPTSADPALPYGVQLLLEPRT